jgi:hypothetical protein
VQRIHARGSVGHERRGRYLADGELDTALARDAAPRIAYANRPRIDYLSARMGCRVYQPFCGIDLASPCIRRRG